MLYCAGGPEWFAAVGNKANMLATTAHIILIFTSLVIENNQFSPFYMLRHQDMNCPT